MRYICTNCGHTFDHRFRCGTSITALCPSCFAPAEKEKTAAEENADRIKRVLDLAGQEAVKAVLADCMESHAEYKNLYDEHIKEAQRLINRILGKERNE